MGEKEEMKKQHLICLLSITLALAGCADQLAAPNHSFDGGPGDVACHVDGGADVITGVEGGEEEAGTGCTDLACPENALCDESSGAASCVCQEGYRATGDAGCEDIDECSLNIDDCDDDPEACFNDSGGFHCLCPLYFTGSGIGGAGCAPVASFIEVSSGALYPAFDPERKNYRIEINRGDEQLTVTVQAQPGVLIEIAGAGARAGVPSSPIPMNLGVNQIEIVLSAGGVSRTYSLEVNRASTVAQQAYIKAGDIAAYSFASSISLSSDGSVLAVGAPFSEDCSSDGAGENQGEDCRYYSGAVYVFVRSGNAWSQQARLVASNADDDDNFGQAVSLSSDGSTLAVGAPFEDSDSAGVDGPQDSELEADSGAVYVFARSGDTWSQQAYLKASNPGEEDHFGNSVSLSSDGNLLAAGAPEEDGAATGIDGEQDNDDAASSGAVYLFARSGEGWSQKAYVKASNTSRYDGFGSSLSLSGDGSALAVGVPREGSAATGIDGDQNKPGAVESGAVYLFAISGDAWSQQAYVKAGNTKEFDNFGRSVCLSADGSTLAVGAPFEDSSATGIDGEQKNDGASASGAVYLFASSGGVWSQQAYVKASNTDKNDQFGWSVSLSSDGGVLAVGARRESGAATGIDGDQSDNGAYRSGAAYLFLSSGEVWSQQAYLKASNTDIEDSFGYSVSLSSDGGVLAIGASAESGGATGINGDQSDNSSPGSGAAYVFRRDDPTIPGYPSL